MKNKIFFILALTLSFILGGLIQSYAAEARAYASVIIIIPPREEKAETNNAKEQGQETTLTQNPTNESGEIQDD